MAKQDVKQIEEAEQESVAVDQADPQPSGSAGLTAENPAAHHAKTTKSNRRGGVRRMVHERCDVLLEALQRDGNGQAQLLTDGCLIDISAGGAGILSSQRIMPGTKLMIAIKSKHATHQFLVTVLWCCELPSVGKVLKLTRNFTWRLGVRFEARTREEVAMMKMLAEEI